MNAAPQFGVRSIVYSVGALYMFCYALALPCVAAPYGYAVKKPLPSTVKVSLSEWKVQLTPTKVPPGPVVFEVTNTGTIAHAFEVEGGRLEKSTPQIRPGASATLNLDLRAGSYETYCPVGKGAHQMRGMMNHLLVGSAKVSSAMQDGDAGTEEGREHGQEYAAGRERKAARVR